MLDGRLGCFCLLANSRVADRSVEQIRTEMALLLAAGLVILFDRFIATDSLFEFLINFATLSDRSFLRSEVIQVNSFFVQWHIPSVISLVLEDI